MSAPERSIIGREDLVDSIMSQMRRPELTNVILVAEAGTGKTALVQRAMQRDTDRVYVEVITAYMLKDLPNRDELATRVRALYEEAILYREREDVELILFEDEFHQLVMNSAASVEALKPLLAESGARGVRTIAATTYEEYHQYIEPNDALMQRLQTLHVPEPDEEVVMAILKDMARKNGVDELLRHTNVYSLIYDYTNRYQVARSQPRKSILLLDLMIGKHRALGRRMDEALLAEALMESANVNVAFQIDATKLKTLLRSRVFAQDLAVEAVSAQLQVSVADLHDHTRPPMSMLLPGSTGVGKTQMTKEVAKILFGDSRRHLRIFDMTEFSLETSVDRFKTELTRHVSERPYSVLLIDEVEKAHKNVVGLLLQVLDDGRLSDEHGRTASFLNTYIIMTTNAGSEVFNEMSQTQANLDHDTEEGRAAAAFQLGEYSRLFRRSVESTTKGSFPPELIGRVRTIAPFRSLDLSTFEKVTMRELESLVTETWKRHGCRVRIQKASKVIRDGREVEVGGVVRFIVHDLIREEAKDGGARQVASLVQEWVTTKVAQYINEHPGVKEIQVKVEGTLMVDDPNTRISSGRVVIDEVRPQDLARAGQWEHSSLDEGEARRVRVR